MNLILALNTEYFANLSTSNSTVGSSDLLALPKTFLSISTLHYGGTYQRLGRILKSFVSHHRY